MLEGNKSVERGKVKKLSTFNAKSQLINNYMASILWDGWRCIEVTGWMASRQRRDFCPRLILASRQRLMGKRANHIHFRLAKIKMVRTLTHPKPKKRKT
jgi:hypothetical protein